MLFTKLIKVQIWLKWWVWSHSANIPRYAKSSCHLWVFVQLCDWAGSQEAIRVSPAEFIWPKRNKIWSHEERKLCTSSLCEAKISPVLEPHNLLCPRVCLEPDLSRAGLPGGRKMGLVDVPWGRCFHQAWEMWRESSPPQSHIIQSVPDYAQNLRGWSH